MIDMPKYRIQINDRKYTKWSILDENNQVIENLAICPIKSKLFNGDNFLYDPSQVQPITILFSNIRNKPQYAGVLDLSKPVSRKDKNRYLYKCFPDDSRLPIFLIPYGEKIGFSKNPINKYVLFQYNHWLYDHPYATLNNVIGHIDDLPAFYEYQLYCKNLHISIKDFTTQTNKKIENKEKHATFIQQIEENPDYQIHDRKTSHRVFSIDPKGSLDFDDAFSIRRLSHNTIKISIYIANVFVWLENLNLWESFSNRVSTIYLPDRKRPMLPTILSDSLCSLQEGVTRFAFTMDITILCHPNGDTLPEIIGEPMFSNTSVVLYKNYVYDEPALLSDPDYYELFEITRRIKPRTIEDSHDVVGYWMIYMNQACGKYMAQEKIGIFRSVVHRPSEFSQDIQHIGQNSRRMIEQWGNTSGQYVRFSEDMTGHQIMNIDSYIHITSPIRRLVDLLNQIELSCHIGIIQNTTHQSFFNKWREQIDYINQSMRLIRKVQEDCEILYRCTANPELLDREHKGILFDRTKKNDGFYNYMVYLEDVGILSKIVTYEELQEYTYMTFRLFLFQGEDKIKRKIRVSICHQC
jgi:exoribonuclease R